MTDLIRAWCLVKGEWVKWEEPVMAVCDPHGGDVRAAMAGLGFELWSQIGVDDLPAAPVTLALYSREAPPLQFLLQLEGNAGNIVEHVFAETLPDAMELLAKWAPIAQGGAVVELVRLAGTARSDVPQPDPHSHRATAPLPSPAMDRVGS